MVEHARILIVDDELGPRESLRIILKPFYDVHTASDGRAALDFLGRNTVDLITLDLKMPGLSGLEVLEQVRKSNPDVLVIIVTGYGTFKSVVEAIRLDVFDYISKPFNIQEILSVVKRCLEMRDTEITIKTIFSEIASVSVEGYSEPRLAKILEMTRRLLRNGEQLGPKAKEISSLELIRMVSEGIEKRDPYSAGHSARVGRYTDSVARKLGLAEEVRTSLQVASYLHDIGKVCISSRFMNNEGKLSSTDWAILKRHPLKSVQLVQPLQLPESTISVIRHHHERFDGTGYPGGLADGEIPLGARILSIGNTYDALMSKKLYRDSMDPAEARAEIERGARTCFDPDLVGIFMEVLREQKDLCQPEGFHERLHGEAL